jgi:putative hydrolase of the HAD superfamily
MANAGTRVSHEPARFDAVVFDLYGTLVYEFDREGFYRTVGEIARELGADPVGFEREWTGTAIERQIGRHATVEENVRVICERLGVAVDDDAIARAMGHRALMYERYFAVRPGAVETLSELRGRGYPLALISMCAPDTPALWHASALAPFMDETVFSSEVGVRKPDPAIYELACARLGVEPADCLYCGDGAYGELTGAEAVGMTAYLIADPAVDPSLQLRPEGETWSGARVEDLRGLLPLLPGLMRPGR